MPSPPQANSLAERVQIEFEMKGVQSDAKREQDTLNRRQKDYSISLKNLKRAEQQLVSTQSLVPFMKRQIEDASRQVVVLKEEGKRQVAAAEEVRREVDVFINNFLKQEGLEAEKAEWVRAVVDEVKSLEEEVVEVAKEERDQRKIVAQLNEEREIEARKAAKAMHGAKAVNEELKVKELIIMDLSKRDAETRAKLREFSKLYATGRDSDTAGGARPTPPLLLTPLLFPLYSGTTSSRPTATSTSTRSSRRRRRSPR